MCTLIFIQQAGELTDRLATAEGEIASLRRDLKSAKEGRLKNHDEAVHFSDPASTQTGVQSPTSTHSMSQGSSTTMVANDPCHIECVPVGDNLGLMGRKFAQQERSLTRSGSQQGLLPRSARIQEQLFDAIDAAALANQSLVQ